MESNDTENFHESYENKDTSLSLTIDIPKFDSDIATLEKKVNDIFESEVSTMLEKSKQLLELKKDIKNASVKIAIESVEKLIKNSLDKSKLDKIYSASIEETKLALKKKSS